MTAELPTEEDVLAMAVLCAIINGEDAFSKDYALDDAVRAYGDDPPELADRIRPPGALEVARARRRDGRPWAAVVADSERRLVAERRRDAVVMAAQEWLHVPTLLAHDGLAAAVSAYEEVR